MTRQEKREASAAAKKYGAKVRAARVKAGLGQRGAAKKLGTYQPTLSIVESGKVTATPALKKRIAKLLGVKDA